jgi:predicted lipoprotein with Yx(FWY)xxD motif
MKKLLIPAASLAAAVALAACGGGGSGSNGSGASTPMAGGSVVSVKSLGSAGRVLVDASGQALYASNQETAAGKVLCTGACNSFWMPATVSHGLPQQGPAASHLGVIKRPDGTKQITYRGKILYSFTEDQPGQVTGDGFQDAFNGQHFTWNVVSAGSNTSSTSSSSTPSSY